MDNPSGPPEDLALEELWDKYLRVLADQENTRKRHQQEVETAREDGITSALREVLPIVDELRRGNTAAQAARGRGSLEKIRKGFGLINNKAQQTLRSIGVEEFKTQDENFDPARMEAIARTPTSKVSPGKVFGEVSSGYLRKGKLLRAAKVAVAVEPEEKES